MPVIKRVRVENVQEVTCRLAEIGEVAAYDALVEAVEAGAALLRDDVRERAPRKTGTLARSITMEPVERRRGEVYYRVGPGKEGWYGRLVELGHAIVRGRRKAEKRRVGYAPPHPFLQPALEERRQDVRRVVSERLWQAIERAAKRWKSRG